MPAPEPLPPFRPDESGFILLAHPEPVHRIRSFVSGDPHGERLRVRYWHRPESGEVRARAWFGAGAEGPPRHAHGGSLAAVLDEVMGVAAWQRGLPVVAKRLEVTYDAPLPLGRDVVCAARVVAVNGRRVEVSGEIGVPALGDEAVYTTASGLFVVIDPARLALP